MISRRCAGIRSELPGLLADEGAWPIFPEELRVHLAECPDCRREAEKFRRLLATLEAVHVPDPGDEYWREFLPRLRGRIAAEGVTRGRRVPTSWIGSLAATAASFLLVGIAVGRWGVPAEEGARLRLEAVAVQSDPDRLQRALDTLIPGSDPAVEPVAAADAPVLAADIERALEDILTEYDADVFSPTREMTPAQQRQLAQALGPGWV